jgi:enoyl-CoA hydratase/carnithine racemase
MEYEFVDYVKNGSIVIITMNRPERRNSFSEEMRRDLDMAFARLDDDDEVRLAILTGTGDIFSSGDDAKEMNNRGVISRKRSIEERRLWEKEIRKRISSGSAYGRLLFGEHYKPLITAVNGRAVGSGCLAALCADLVIATESASFHVLEPQRGGTDGGLLMASQSIPFHIALEISLGMIITARRAYEVGLINRVVPSDQLMAMTMEMAQYLVELPPLSLKYTVEGARRMRTSSLHPGAMALGMFQDAYVCAESDDYFEAFAAFLEKRKPRFQGI